MDDVTSRRFTFKKTVSWYITHNILMLSIGYALTGTIAGGVFVALGETLGEMVLLYIHERIWVRIAIRKGKNANI